MRQREREREREREKERERERECESEKYTHMFERPNFPISVYKLFMKFGVTRLKFGNYRC